VSSQTSYPTCTTCSAIDPAGSAISEGLSDSGGPFAFNKCKINVQSKHTICEGIFMSRENSDFYHEDFLHLYR